MLKTNKIFTTFIIPNVLRYVELDALTNSNLSGLAKQNVYFLLTLQPYMRHLLIQKNLYLKILFY